MKHERKCYFQRLNSNFPSFWCDWLLLRVKTPDSRRRFNWNPFCPNKCFLYVLFMSYWFAVFILFLAIPLCHWFGVCLIAYKRWQIFVSAPGPGWGKCGAYLRTFILLGRYAQDGHLHNPENEERGPPFIYLPWLLTCLTLVLVQLSGYQEISFPCTHSVGF